MAIGQKERDTQNRVIELFRTELGYDYLGNWMDRANNSNVEVSFLSGYLKKAGYSESLISSAIFELQKEADNRNDSLYTVNQRVYSLLRYGVKVKEKVGGNFTNVYLINWQEPEKNHFAIAEEVTIFGKKDKRPDIVLYVNGIALAVLELKRRTNRLDSDDKDFGYIVDYKDLFKKVEGAISVYNSELDEGEDKKDQNIYMQERLEIGKKLLDTALEAMETLIEPISNPENEIEYIRYFCGNPELTEELKKTEHLRIALYKGTVTLVRAFASIAGELKEAGYDSKDIERIPKRIEYFSNLREEIKSASGEYLDTKPFEVDMRNLLDMYIKAEDSRVVTKLDNMPLIELIVESGIGEAIKELNKPKNRSKESIAENIEQNIRSKIIKDYLLDPQFFEKMSQLLTQVIQERKSGAISYEEYLKKIEKIIQETKKGKEDNLPEELNTLAKIALYHNLNRNLDMALQLYNAIIQVKKDAFRGNIQKENEIKNAMFQILKDIDVVEHIFTIVKAQSEF
jgi:type I restriction enzyme, R subunit